MDIDQLIGSDGWNASFRASICILAFNWPRSNSPLLPVSCYPMQRALDSECSYNLLGVIGCVVTDFSVPTCFALSAMNRRGWESLAENHQRWFSLSTISISCWIVEARGTPNLEGLETPWDHRESGLVRSTVAWIHCVLLMQWGNGNDSSF